MQFQRRLQLMREACAVKWFSQRGNNKCEVCQHEVKNLLVTLLRMQSSVQRSNRQEHNQESMNSESIRWVNYGLGCSWFLSQYISLLKSFQIVYSCFFLNIFIAKSNRKQQHTDEAELPNRNQIAKSFQCELPESYKAYRKQQHRSSS